MKDYIEREAAIAEMDVAFPAAPSSEFSKGVAVGVAMAKLAVCHLPAADVRPVVLCRDCKYSYDSVGGWCCSHGICVDCIVREDFFCADGEKREES